MIILKLIRLKDWHHYIFICSIYFFIFNNSLSIVYIISLIFILSGIYMLNDFSDLEIDSIKPRRDYKFIAFKKNNKVLIKYVFSILLLLSLLGFFIISINRFITASLVIFIMALYSHKKFYLKSMPIIDLFCICLTYTFLILTSFKNINLEAFLLSFIIGFMALDAHILQSIRDLECDSEYNIRTTASYLGEERSFDFFRIMVILTIAYIAFALYKVLNVYYSLVSALLLPIVFEKRRNPEILWNNFKILSGIIFCFIIIGLIR